MGRESAAPTIRERKQSCLFPGLPAAARSKLRGLNTEFYCKAWVERIYGAVQGEMPSRLRIMWAVLPFLRGAIRDLEKQICRRKE